MPSRDLSGKINVKVLVILVLLLVALGGSLFAARQVRRRILAERDVKAGLAAYEARDWEAAYKHFQEYLGRRPDDVEILKKYAKARVSVQPLNVAHVQQAIAAYRRVLQVEPADDAAYEKLAMLYAGIGNFDELAYISRRRLEGEPNDPKAMLWLGDALTRLDKKEEGGQIFEAVREMLGPASGVSGGKHVEYVRACQRLSEIAVEDDSAEGKTKALELLNDAVSYDFESAEALVFRAHFYRVMETIPNLAAAEALALARKDLEAADRLAMEEPRLRLSLAQEWMAHGQLDKAAAEMQACENIAQDVLEEHYLDVKDWEIDKFRVTSQIALRQGDTARAAALTDNILSVLQERRHRVQVLTSAVQVYVVAGRTAEARKCLNECFDVIHLLETTADTKRGFAYLQALVARAEDKPYMVIDALQSLTITDTSQTQLWQLLAEAFSRTDQPRRAVSALIQYLRHDPQNPEMTLQLAKEYLKLRDWNKAFNTARLAESLNPADIILQLLRIEASVYLETERGRGTNTARLEEYSAELAGLREEYPDRVDIRLLQAIIADYFERPEEAESELKLAIEECRDPLRAEMELTRHYYRLKRMSDAISTSQRACIRHPEVSEPWLSLAGLHAANNDYQAARDSLREGLKAVPAGGWEARALNIALAVQELTHGEAAEGIRILSDLVARDEYEIYGRALLLNVKQVRRDRAKAEGLVVGLKKAEGESGLQWRVHQASLWLAADDWRARQQDITGLLQYCIDADPGWSSPVLLLVQMYEKLEDSRRVEDLCRQALARNPSATDIADRLIALLERQNRFEEAQEVLQRAETDPRVASAWRIRTALRAGDLSPAVDELKLRVSNDDRDASSRILLARLVYWQTRDAAQALKYLAEAETITPATVALIAVKVSILRAEGQTEEAQRLLDEYVANREDFGAYAMRAAYLTGQGELERAEQDYRKLTTFPDRTVSGYALLSSFHVRNQDLAEAVTALEEGLNTHPDDLTLSRSLMKLLFTRGSDQDWEKAIGILAVLEKRFPDDPELLKLRAMALLREPTIESQKAARGKLENVVRLEPTAEDAYLALIDMAMQAGDYEAARDYAIRGIGSNPESTSLMVARSRAELALINDNTRMATELVNLALQQDSSSVEAISMLLELAGRSRDPNPLLERARILAESAISRDPTNEPQLLLRAHVLTTQKRPQAAIPALESYCATDKGRGSIPALVTLADLHRLSGDTDRAGQYLDRAAEVDSNSMTVAYGRLVWLLAQKRFDAASRLSAAFFSAGRQDAAVVLKAARALSGSGSTELEKESLKLYEYAGTLSPMSAEPRLGLASGLYQAGDVERAAKIYRELLDQYPRETRALNDLAWILQEHYHNYPDALELANKGLNLVGGGVARQSLLDTRGAILSKMPDRLADAKTDFETLLGELPEEGPANIRRRAKAMLQLGRACLKLNELNEAKQHLNRALEIDGETPVFTREERSEIAEMLEESSS